MSSFLGLLGPISLSHPTRSTEMGCREREKDLMKLALERGGLANHESGFAQYLDESCGPLAKLRLFRQAAGHGGQRAGGSSSRLLELPYDQVSARNRSPRIRIELCALQPLQA